MITFSAKTDPDQRHWEWRQRFAVQMADQMDLDRFGVFGVYLIGSVKHGTAGPGSDLDLLIHWNGDESDRCRLMDWLEGWSLCLGELNRQLTGTDSGPLLDVHLITDTDIRNRTSFAVMIGSLENSARPLRLRESSPSTHPML